MTMTHDQLHTHGPDELAMLRAECDKWHKAYDRVWEERMRFADRAIELEKENANLKRDKGMRERRLRRALWRAIALFCARSCEYFNGIMSHCLIGQEDLYKRCEEKKNKYLHATYKCQAKMEKYR